jgi:carbonic anhydrase
MRLVEAMVEANHRALAGDTRAGLRPAEHAESLPLVVLTCFDPRLHPLMPEVLGVAEADFIWLTNAGNGLTGSGDATLRSLALACAVQGGREIAIIGHTDCCYCGGHGLGSNPHWQASQFELGPAAAPLRQFLERPLDELSNVGAAVSVARASPLISRRVPVHGLLVDLTSGRLEWVVNGYEAGVGLAVGAGPAGAEEGLVPPRRSGAVTPPEFRVGGDLPPIGGG